MFLDEEIDVDEHIVLKYLIGSTLLALLFIEISSQKQNQWLVYGVSMISVVYLVLSNQSQPTV